MFSKIAHLSPLFSTEELSNLDQPVPLAQCIVPRKDDSSSNKYNANQSKYIELSFEVCENLKEQLKETPPSFADVLTTVGKGRRKIAKHFDSFQCQLFGVQREGVYDRLSTSLVEEYAEMGKDIDQISEDDSTMHWESYEEGGIKEGFRKGIDFEGEEIFLTRYILYHNERTIAHTYPNNLEAAKEHCTHLYNEILRLEAPSHGKEIHRLIGELHWWMSQATFYKRGSAACSEIIVGALLLQKWGNLTPYKIGIFADRMALTTSCEQFVQIYSSLREN
ncbi:MAG: hypothetical protein K940chlam9_00162 [Chlamydiae bacterium]|nr:hypothetical protein [Chlamydiota bacterium]